MSGNAITTTAHKTAKVEHSNISPGRKPASFFLVFFCCKQQKQTGFSPNQLNRCLLVGQVVRCATVRFDSRALYLRYLWFLVGSSFLELRTT